MKKKVEKKVENKSRRWNSTLLVFDTINKGIHPSHLWEKNILSKDQVKYALTKLKQTHMIRKIGYGTWEIVPENERKILEKKVEKSSHVGQIPFIKKYAVRGHGIVATLRLPMIPGWEYREGVLKRLKIPYKSIKAGQRIRFEDIEKIWLTRKSIVFYLEGRSFFARTAQESADEALEWLLKKIKHLERHLGVKTFAIRGRYKIRFSRQHYALIKNAMAKQYHKEKKKLTVYDESGLWLLIDNSYNLHELETVHPKTAVDDNKTVQNALNAWKRGLTPDFMSEKILSNSEQLGQLAEKFDFYARNAVTHTGYIRDAGKATNALKDEVRTLAETVQKLVETVKELKKE